MKPAHKWLDGYMAFYKRQTTGQRKVTNRKLRAVQKAYIKLIQQDARGLKSANANQP